jgi:WD40 repeat protein
MTQSFIGELEHHTRGVKSVKITLDGRHAVSGSEDQTAKVWDLWTQTCLGALGDGSLGGGEMTTLDISPDGRIILVGREDCLTLWAACPRMIDGWI